jgi:hypothetical protein
MESSAWEYNRTPLFLGGYEYGDLALQVGGVSNLRQENTSHESRGSRTEERLRWRGPAAVVNDRPILSSERAPHINKPATV